MKHAVKRERRKRQSRRKNTGKLILKRNKIYCDIVEVY